MDALFIEVSDRSAEQLIIAGCNLMYAAKIAGQVKGFHRTAREHVLSRRGLETRVGKDEQKVRSLSDIGAPSERGSLKGQSLT